MTTAPSTSRKATLRVGAIAVSIVALLCMSCSAPDGARSKERLRVTTYNVFVGFKNDDERHDQAMAWIAEQKPDVVALQELNGYTETKLEEDARTWGHSHVLLHKVKSGFHLGITSREPFENVRSITTEGLWHGVAHARTLGIDFFVLHLAPKPEEIRLLETKIVIEEIRKIQSADRPTVLLGDFNSPSRLDADYYDLNARYETQFNVMDQYLDGGWVDLVHGAQGNITETQMSFPSLLVENKWGFSRIDYVLASEQLARRCVMAQVMNRSATDSLSDHYPVMVDFEWP